jgi:hypothetical protein
MKNILLTIGLVLAVTAAVYYAFKYYNCKAKIPAITTKVVDLDTSFKAPIISEYRDSNNAQHVVVASKINSIIEKGAVQKASELKPIVDNIAKSLDIKSDQLESGMQINTRILQDSIKFLRKQLDNANQTTYYYKDKYLSLAVRTNNNPTDTLDKGNFDFAYDASLNITQYWKRNKFLGIPLGAKNSFTDISSNDPRVTISGVKKYTISQKEPEFGLRLQAVGAYNINTKGFSVGPSLRFDFLKSSLRGTYYYNFQTNQWTPSITLEKDIFRL